MYEGNVKRVECFPAIHNSGLSNKLNEKIEKIPKNNFLKNIYKNLGW